MLFFLLGFFLFSRFEKNICDVVLAVLSLGGYIMQKVKKEIFIFGRDRKIGYDYDFLDP